MPGINDLAARRLSMTGGSGGVMLAGPNKRRIYLAAQNDIDSTGTGYVFLGDNPANFATDPVIPLMPGQWVILSITGDMPWLGGVYGYAAAGTTVNAVECGYYPFEGQ